MSVHFRIGMSITLIAAFMASGVAYAGGGGGTNIRRDTLAVVRNVSGNAFFFTRSSNDASCTSGTVGIIAFGDPAIDTFLAIDLDGDGLDQPAVFRDGGGFGTFFVRNEVNPANPPVQIDFGAETDIPIAGNLDPSDAGDEVGVYRASNNTFYLLLDSGLVELAIGAAGDLPVVGNFDGSVNGSEEVGVFRPSTNQFFFRATNDPMDMDNFTVRDLGTSGDTGMVGDWDGNGSATPGVNRVDPGTGLAAFLTNGTTGTSVDSILYWGNDTGDIRVVGDWDGRTVDNDGC